MSAADQALAGGDLAVSAISFWAIAMLIRRGRLSLARPVASWRGDFLEAGLALASEFQVHSYTINDQESPAIAADADGDFIVVWEINSGQDGSSYGVFAQRFRVPVTLDVNGNGGAQPSPADSSLSLQ